MLNKISENTYIMPHRDKTDRPSLALISGEKYSLIIDSGNSPRHAQEFLDEISNLDVPPLKYLIITHSHWDHIFGINEMNLITICQRNCAKKIEELRELNWDDDSLDLHLKSGLLNELGVSSIKEEIPNREGFTIGSIDIVFDDHLDIDLGNLTCNITSIGGCHTDGSTVVHVPEDKVLFLGDCVYGKRYDGIYGYEMRTLSNMIDKIDAFDADTYIISHEDIFTKKMIQSFWQDIRDTYQIAHEGLNLESSIKKFKNTFNKEIDDNTSFLLDSFIKLEKTNLNSIWSIS